MRPVGHRRYASAMNYRITGLPAADVSHLFGLDDAALAERGAKRYIVDAHPGVPDRITMRDLAIGERAILLNYTHHSAPTPYRSSHAIFVAEGATETYDRVNEIPAVLQRRLLSLRGFDAEGMMIDADVVDGSVLEAAIRRMFADAAVAYAHVHNAKAGCYAGRIDRA